MRNLETDNSGYLKDQCSHRSTEEREGGGSE